VLVALRRFPVRLGLVGLVGLAVRWAAVAVHYRKLSPPPPDLTDNTWYWLQSDLLADGKGFANPLIWYKQCVVDQVSCAVSHSAGKPPLYTSYLAIFHLLGLESPLSMRLASGLLGAAAVVGVGLLARRLTGSDRAGLIAAVFAALYPNLWMNDALILSESMYAPVIVALLWATYAVIERPTWQRAAALGAMIGVACLTRSESQILVVLLVGPLVLWSLRSIEWRQRIAVGAVSVLCAGLVVSPWVAKNLSEFEHPVFISIGTGFVLDVSNCDSTYYGDLLGYTDANCSNDDWPPDADESEIELILREDALEYIRTHKSRIPVVVLARVGRMWNVYRPLQGVDLDVFFERRAKPHAQAALWSYYALGALAVAGAMSMWRAKRPLLPFGVMIAMVSFTAASSMPITRYRVAAEVVWVVLAGIGADWLWSRRSQRSQSAESPTDAATTSAISAVER
jgi:4-amino-4-deoxy-L-arabinose transferase-like glycosyltransferase